MFFGWCLDVAGEDCLEAIASNGCNPPALLPVPVECRWCEVRVEGCNVGDDPCDDRMCSDSVKHVLLRQVGLCKSCGSEEDGVEH